MPLPCATTGSVSYTAAVEIAASRDTDQDPSQGAQQRASARLDRRAGSVARSLRHHGRREHSALGASQGKTTPARSRSSIFGTLKEKRWDVAKVAVRRRQDAAQAVG